MYQSTPSLTNKSKCNNINNNNNNINNELVGMLENFEQELAPAGPLIARLKARQQLCVSEDSPFSYLRQRTDEFFEEELNKVREEKTKLLRDETEQLKRQLELVKSRLNELNQHECDLDANDARKKLLDNQNDHEENNDNDNENDDDGSMYLCAKHKMQSNNNNEINNAKTNGNEAEHEHKQQRLRPLTGKTDCPNCSCDRRHSVCDKCLAYSVNPASHQDEIKSNSSKQKSDTRRPSFMYAQQEEEEEEEHNRSRRRTLSRAQGKHRTSSIWQTIPKSNFPVTTIKTTSPTITATVANYDERPIKPLRTTTTTTTDNNQQIPLDFRREEIEQVGPNAKIEVDHTIVPNRIYTIGKSLDDKRSQLAKAIEELQSMMEKVRERGERLEQERKVAQLYKEQWRYGPRIGGGNRLRSSSATRDQHQVQPSSAAQLTSVQQYVSRLDPELARDTNSLMGFQNVESSLKLRQYNGSYSSAGVRGSSSSSRGVAPRPKPRFAKMAAQTAASRAKMVNKRNDGAQAIITRLRPTKSMESLNNQSMIGIPISKQITTSSGMDKITATQGELKEKSASETNLAFTGISIGAGGAAAGQDDTIEEELEDDIREDSSGTVIDVDEQANRKLQLDHAKQSMIDDNSVSNSPMVTEEVYQENVASPGADDHLPKAQPNHRIQKMTWMPVFGETEIKTITRRTPVRKVQVLPPPPPPQPNKVPTPRTTSILRSSNATSGYQPKSAMRTVRSKTSTTNDRVMNEATKKLQFANHLLDKERQDSQSKNQLTVKRNILTTRPTSSTSHQPAQSAKPRTILTRAKSDFVAGNSRKSSNATNVMTRSSSTLRNSTSNNTNKDKQVTSRSTKTTTADKQTTLSNESTREILCLERMIIEQQKLLQSLTGKKSSSSQPIESEENDENDLESDTASCSCQCCNQTNLGINSTNSNQTAVKTRSISPAKLLDSALPSATISMERSRHNARMIQALRDKLHKTKVRLAKTLEEEKERHARLEKRVDLSLKKQTDLENENELLKKSLGKCIDTCLQDISSTFESLSDTLNDSMGPANAVTKPITGVHDDNDRQRANNFEATTDSSTCSISLNTHTSSSSISTPLTNVAQLIQDNRHLKRMKSHIDSVEQQRRAIFEELSNEKLRSQKLELELQRSKEELQQLMEARQRLENATNSQLEDRAQTAGGSHVNQNEEISTLSTPDPIPSTSKAQATTSTNPIKSPLVDEINQVHQITESSAKDLFADQDLGDSKNLASEENSSTFNSIDIYRQYIQSMSPDLDALRRERQMILGEFDNIKKMLIEIER